MDEQDEYLRQIIAAVRQHPDRSLERRKAMHHLLSYVQRLPGLTKCSHPDYPDVLNATLVMVSTRIQEFQPRPDSLSSSLAAWINYRLRHKYRILELYRHNSSERMSEKYKLLR